MCSAMKSDRKTLTSASRPEGKVIVCDLHVFADAFQRDNGLAVHLDRRIDRRSSAIVTVASPPRSNAARRVRMRVLWLSGTANALLAAGSHSSSAILSRCVGDNRLSLGKSANVMSEGGNFCSTIRQPILQSIIASLLEELFIKSTEAGSLPYPKGLLPVGRGLCE